MIEKDIDDKILRLVDEWNVAERRIKKAEMVSGGEVVGSAIFELRYAGRKVIDALERSIKGDITKDAKLYSEVREFIEDAIEDCIKSKHDAIDAMLTFVTIWFSDMEKQIGEENLMELFTDYVDLTSKISHIQDLISLSRQDRTAGRNGIYDEIEKSDFDAILALFLKMKNSEERIKRIVATRLDERARQQRAQDRATKLAWGAFIATLLGLAVAVAAYFKN